MTQLQHNVPTATAGNLAANNTSRDAQRQAASAQLKQATQRSNYRGYDSTPTQQQRREAAKTQLKTPRRSNSSVEKPPGATSRTAHLSSSSAGSSSSPPRQPSVSRRSAICAPTPLAATKAAPLLASAAGTRTAEPPVFRRKPRVTRWHQRTSFRTP